MEVVADSGTEVAMQVQIILMTKRVAKKNVSLLRVQRPAFYPKMQDPAKECTTNGFLIWILSVVHPLSTEVVWAMPTDFLLKVLARTYAPLKMQWNCVTNRNRKEHATACTHIFTLIETSETVCHVSGDISKFRPKFKNVLPLQSITRGATEITIGFPVKKHVRIHVSMLSGKEKPKRFAVCPLRRGIAQTHTCPNGRIIRDYEGASPFTTRDVEATTTYLTLKRIVSLFVRLLLRPRYVCPEVKKYWLNVDRMQRCI